uniref:Uncharacterized protein n=1 Tax=Oryza glumipatula TaxID=40148 RepID=A0A0D9YM73_9ORYZ
MAKAATTTAAVAAMAKAAIAVTAPQQLRRQGARVATTLVGDGSGVGRRVGDGEARGRWGRFEGSGEHGG